MDRAAERIVAKLMARPMTVLRNATERGESVDSVSAMLRSLFTGSQPVGAESE